ncbi:hypothetical protein PQA69_gp02 [Yersinia phage vB_YenM_324]|uniref:hypothetical protein n=1 Tax=Yersinia phage vB_YenM_324 TaxID=2914024 RepID=UPI00232915E6|nr:hypothetical protein PQA69_gp02 [Yersinia phage vB_YenM_324]UKL54189.1 hypothetical protein vBYenM324_002 [Yersinia phage vB_YenM_324]
MLDFFRNLFKKPVNNLNNCIIDDRGDFIYEDNLDPDSFKFKMKDGNATLWEGKSKPIEFSFRNENDKKERVVGEICKVSITEKGDFLLYVNVDEKPTPLIVKESYIETKFLVGTVRHNFQSLCENLLKINLSDIFGYAKAIRHIAAQPKIKKTFPPLITSFTYLLNEVRHKKTIAIDQYLDNTHGFRYLSGICQTTKKREVFDEKKIVTMLDTTGHPKYKFNDWLVNVGDIK